MKRAILFKGGKQMSKKLFLSTALLLVFFAVILASQAYAEGENLIKNAGFEDGTGKLPDNWRFEAFNQEPDVTKYSIEANAHTGSKCFVIENIKENDVKLIQDVKVELGKVYKISYWIKAENFAPTSVAGGNLTIMNGIFEAPPIIDTKGQWQKVEAYTRVRSSGTNTMNVALRVGGFGTVVKGKAYFDDISMELVENPPAGVKIIDFFVPGAPASNNNASGSDKDSPGGINKTLIIVIVIAVVIGLLVFVEVKFAKRGNKGEEETNGEEEEYEEEETEDNIGDEKEEKEDKKDGEPDKVDKDGKNYD